MSSAVRLLLDRPKLVEPQSQILRYTRPEAPPVDEADEGLLALLVTDLEGFTPLVERLGDEAGRELMHVHNALVRGCIRRRNGREVAHTGDGVLAAFRSMTAALHAAVEIQHALCEHNGHADEPLRARIGLHAGEPLPEDGRLIGTCVNTTVRVCGAARPESVLVSDLARSLALGKSFRFAPGTQVALKGLSRPMCVHELLWRRH